MVKVEKSCVEDKATEHGAAHYTAALVAFLTVPVTFL
jgi:hypothetical protein